MGVMMTSKLTLCFATHTSLVLCQLFAKRGQQANGANVYAAKTFVLQSRTLVPFYPYDGRLHDGPEVGRELAGGQDFCLRRIKISLAGLAERQCEDRLTDDSGDIDFGIDDLTSHGMYSNSVPVFDTRLSLLELEKAGHRERRLADRRRRYGASSPWSGL